MRTETPERRSMTKRTARPQQYYQKPKAVNDGKGVVHVYIEQTRKRYLITSKMASRQSVPTTLRICSISSSIKQTEYREPMNDSPVLLVLCLVLECGIKSNQKNCHHQRNRNITLRILFTSTMKRWVILSYMIKVRKRSPSSDDSKERKVSTHQSNRTKHLL